MFRLRSSILAQFLSSPATYHFPSTQRLIAATAPAISRTTGFAVDDYLVATCGLTPAQALKASRNISHLKSPSRPGSVLAFLAGLGLSTADVAAAVTSDPRLLCASVERTLAPNVAELTALGLSRAEIARLVRHAPDRFRYRSIISNLQYCLPLFGSFEKLLRAVKFNTDLLSRNIERVLKPNVAVLRECGLGDCDIAKPSLAQPRLLTNNFERFREIVACAQGLGVPRGAPMFRHALQAVSFLSQEKIAAKMEFLKKTFRWSDAELGIALSRSPCVLTKSKDMLHARSDFLMSDVGLEPAYIAHRPALLGYSLEGRLRPRYYVVKFLKENGLINCNQDYYNAVMLSGKFFMEKFICSHKEAAPHLADEYATAYRGMC